VFDYQHIARFSGMGIVFETARQGGPGLAFFRHKLREKVCQTKPNALFYA